VGNRMCGPHGGIDVLPVVGGHASTGVQRCGCKHAKGGRNVVLVARDKYVTRDEISNALSITSMTSRPGARRSIR
jgi:hypothetical protein